MNGHDSCRVTTVIYDCDGVIFESFEANFAFYAKVLAHFGRPPLDKGDADTMRLLHTYSSRDVLAELLGGDLLEEALRFAAAIDYRELIPFMHMEEGFVDTLEKLKGRVNLAVCTNRSTSMDTLLEDFGLAPYFTCVMTALKVTNPKPHPEPLLRILDYYRISPAEALFVGDSDLDRRAAEAAGIPFIAYKSDLPCMVRIERHPEILELVDCGTLRGEK